MAKSRILDLRKEPQADQISWKSREFTGSGDESAAWFLGVLLIAAGLFIWAIWSLNFLFALFLFLATVSLIVWSRIPPKIYEFRVGQEGVWIGEKLWPMDELESFWVFNFPDAKLLSLRPKKKLSSHIRMPLTEDVADRVLVILRRHLSEQEENYSLIDLLADRLHF